VPRQKSAPSPRATSPAVHLLRRIVAGVLGLLLFAGTAGALAIALYPTVTSGAAMAVLSGSMSPTYPVGAMMFTRPVDPAEVDVGDVITFNRPSNQAELVSHRVVAVDTSSGSAVFTTKGDANDAADLDPVPASLVQGRLWFGVPQLGRIAALLHSAQGLGLLVLLVCAVVAVSPGKRAEAEEPTNEPEAAPSRVRPRLDAADEEPTAVLPAVGRSAVRRVTGPLPPVPPPSRSALTRAR
jgi:signal peptidase